MQLSMFVIVTFFIIFMVVRYEFSNLFFNFLFFSKLCLIIFLIIYFHNFSCFDLSFLLWFWSLIEIVMIFSVVIIFCL